jgi:protein arginine kinase
MKRWYETPGPQQEAVLSSCVRVSRSLRGIPFPDGLDADGKRTVVQKLHDAVFNENSAVSHEFRFLDLAGLKSDEAVALAERGVLKAEFAENRGGRCLLVSGDESQSIMANGEDHFLIQVRSPGLSLKEAYAAADRLDTILDKSLHFAYDGRLGYLTCNPAILGTGMVASLNLHLPALADTGATARIAFNLRPLGITLGSAMQPHGSVYRLSNRMTLGLSEQAAVTNLCGIARQIIEQECDARKKLIRNITVQDTVGRSLGIFRSARLLSYNEFLDLASIVRFGIASGFVKGYGVEDVDGLIMRVQPANLVLKAGVRLTEDEERAMRAQVVREAFSEQRRGRDGREGNG